MRVIQPAKIRQYELTYLIPGSFSKSEVSRVSEEVKKLLKKHSIKVLSEDDWGKRDLAYPIKYQSKKNYEAFYTHLGLEADAENIGEFEKGLRLIQEIIRQLIVLAEAETSNLEDLKVE